MKTTQKNTTTTNLQQQTNAPFFQRKETDATSSDRTFFTSKTNQNTPFFNKTASPSVQTKLTIGQPGDKYEREADAVADRVVKGNHRPSPAPEAASAPPVQHKCADCEQKEKLQKKEGEEELPQAETDVQLKPIFESGQEPPPEETSNNNAVMPMLMRKCSDCGKEEAIQTKSDGSESTASPDLQSRLSGSKGGGSALPTNVQSSMESGIGADFSGVRVHTDSAAVQMNKDLGAQAFTHGSDIYFNEGKYDAGSNGGQHLLAHELTHTVQQGAAIQKKETISNTTQPKIQRSWIGDKIADGLNWAAEKLVPGYSLLNVILGKNLITGRPVARSGVNLIQGFMELLPVVGSILFNELKETESLNDAGIWVEEQIAKFNVNFDEIAKNLDLMWEELSVWNSMDTNVAIFKKYVSPWLNKFLNFASTVRERVKALRLEGALRLVGAHELLDALKKSPEAMKRVVDNPKLIFKFFIDALKQGFQSFKENFGMHFKNALFGWLFGKAAEMGVTMPKQLNIAGLFGLIAQILGLTYQYIRALVVKALGAKGEQIVSKLEKTAEIIIDFYKRGPIAIWDRVKDFLVNLKDTIFTKITELVTGEIIKAAVGKLVSMLNPAGAIVQLALTIYRVVKYFIDWWDTIKEIASGVLSSITKVALGMIGGAAKFIEGLFAKGMKLIIAFLARIFGLGGIAEKVKVLIKKISAPVKNAMTNVVNWIVKMGKSLFNKAIGKGKSVLGKALNLLGIKKKFKDKSNKSHTLYFKGKDRNSDLMVASRPQLAHDLINEILKTTNDKKLIRKLRNTLNLIYKEKLKIVSPKKDNSLSINKIESLVKVFGELLGQISIDGKSENMIVVNLKFNHLYAGMEGEYQRQLNEQENEINSMTISKWLSNRFSFEKKGRIADSNFRVGLNKQYSKDFNNFEELQKSKGLNKIEIMELWNYQQAATHSLDQVAGGNHDRFSGVGNSSVNSHIGTQWSNKIPLIMTAIEMVNPSSFKDIKMNVKLKLN